MTLSLIVQIFCGAIGALATGGMFLVDVDRLTKSIGIGLTIIMTVTAIGLASFVVK